VDGALIPARLGVGADVDVAEDNRSRRFPASRWRVAALLWRTTSWLDAHGRFPQFVASGRRAASRPWRL
jgi:hypothetical protein